MSTFRELARDCFQGLSAVVVLSISRYFADDWRSWGLGVFGLATALLVIAVWELATSEENPSEGET